MYTVIKSSRHRGCTKKFKYTYILSYFIKIPKYIFFIISQYLFKPLIYNVFIIKILENKIK